MWIYREKESDALAHIAGDTATYYYRNEGEYNRFESNQFKFNNEISLFYRFAIKKFYIFNNINVAKYEVKINTETHFSPEEGMIKTDVVAEYLEQDVVVNESIYIDVVDRDKMFFTHSYLSGGKEVEQLAYNLIFKKADNDSIFDIMDSFIIDSIQNYTQKVFEKREEKVKAEVGDTLDVDYEFVGVSGESVNLKDFLQKNDYAIIYTWGTWCGPCIFNTDNVKKFNNDYNSPGFFTLIHEHGRATLEQKKQYVERKKVPYPVFTNEDFVKTNNLISFPTFLVLDKQGIIVDKHEGTTKEADYLYEEFTKYRNK